MNVRLSPGYKQQRQYWAEANWNVGPVKITYLPAFRTWYQDDHLSVDRQFHCEWCSAASDIANA